MTEYLYSRNKQLQASADIVMKRVLTIYTGGTIGMVHSQDGLVPGAIRDLVCKFPMLNDVEYKFTEEELESFPFEPLALPITANKYRVFYCVMTYDPLLDSSNMGMEDWASMASDIEKYYRDFDAFIILHGTDTMCYTASALSFMLENLGKTVIITGSQVPLMELRSDGRDNLLDALILCGEHIIPEVCILFNSKLFRGNRCSKKDSASMDAFSCPNLPPLAVLEVDINVDWSNVYRGGELDKFKVQTEMNANVGILRLFPGITPVTVHAFLQPPMEGAVLLSFGSGNVPDQKQLILDELKAATERGVLIINCSQCSRGHVNDKYAAGTVLRKLGVIPGADMTPEAALAKLSYVLSKHSLTVEERKEWMVKNLRGELTVLPQEAPSSDVAVGVGGLMPILMNALSTSSAKEKKQVLQHLMPQLMCSYAADGDMAALLQLREQGGDFSLPDYDLRTPLHVACSQGHLATVRMLLEHGASVHLKDRFGHTPLMDTIRFKHFEIIELLVQTGAHLASTSKSYIASKICKAAVEDDVESLRAWQLAGANMNMEDYHRSTPLDMAKQHVSKKSIHFLTQYMASQR